MELNEAGRRATITSCCAARAAPDWTALDAKVRRPTTAGVACEENGQTALRPGFPSFSTAFVRRTEHLCVPSFLQQAGTSDCARSIANAGRSGPAPNRKTNSAASVRRKAYSDYRMPSHSTRSFRSSPNRQRHARLVRFRNASDSPRHPFERGQMTKMFSAQPEIVLEFRHASFVYSHSCRRARIGGTASRVEFSSRRRRRKAARP